MGKGILINRSTKEIDSSSKMEHENLLAEMHAIENLPTQERLHLARTRRAQQLKQARQKEKEWAKLQRSHKHSQAAHSKRNNQLPPPRRHISFENSVVLLEAASRNDIQEVANLLQRGITPDAANEDGLTALHQCCIDNNIEMLKLLLDYGANVDAQDSDKWTPLHAAATCGHLNLVKILIGRGANLLAVNTDGNMPYDLCDDEDTLDYIEAEMSKRGVTQELIDDTRAHTEKQMLNDLMHVASVGGDLEEPDYQGATPLHIAAANGYARVVEFLLEHHVNVDSIDKDLWSPVHAAACWGHMEVLELLALYGADLYAKNKDDETPADICEDPEIRERIELLKTEQESKRLAEQQRRRVRRSQSNNTRAQSVRRTSLRDKTLTTKKDAVEETRLRLQAQEVYIAPDSTTEPKSIGNDSILSQNSITPSVATTSATITSGTSSSLPGGPNSLPSRNNIIPNNIIVTNSKTNNTKSLNQTAITGNSSGRRKSASSIGSGIEVSSTNSEIDGNLNGNLRNSNSSGNIKYIGSGGTITTSSASSNNNNSNSLGNLRKNSFSQTHRSDNSINNNSNQYNGFSNTNLINNYNNNTARDVLTNGCIIESGLNDKIDHHKNTNQQQQDQLYQSSQNYNLQNQLHANAINSTANLISRRPPEGKDNEEQYSMNENSYNLENGIPAVSNNNTSTSLPPSSVFGANTNVNVHKMNNTTAATTATGNITTNNSGSFTADRPTADIFQATKENGKINVQVTVLVDTHNLDNALNQSGATLANLKKQRSQSRTTALTENGSAIGYGSSTQQHQQQHQQQQQSITNYNNNNNQQIQKSQILNGLQNSNVLNTNEFILTPKLDSTTTQPITSNLINNTNVALLNTPTSPASSSNDFNQIIMHQQQQQQQQQQQNLSPTTAAAQNNVNKFSGITSDVVSDSTSSKKCCILM